MVKKMITSIVLVVILMSLTGCSIKTTEFDTLEEMQTTLFDDFYYFDLDSEMFGEAKDITVNEWVKSIHEDKTLFRYSIWYDIVNHDNGQEYRLNIVGTHLRRPITITEQYIKTDKIIYNAVVIDIMDIEGYYYYFILQGSKHIPDENEVEYFLPIIQSIIETKHKLES